MGDLNKLIEAVEAGNWSGSWRLVLDLGIDAPRFNDAYHGSLDAAKALHEALLPGWSWERSWSGYMMVSLGGMTHKETNTTCPARAWMLAILKAYRAQQP